MQEREVEGRFPLGFVVVVQEKDIVVRKEDLLGRQRRWQTTPSNLVFVKQRSLSNDTPGQSILSSASQVVIKDFPAPRFTGEGEI